MTIIGPDQMPQAGMAQAIAALRIETKTHMKASRINWLAHAKKTWGLKARTRVDVLAQLEALYLETYGKAYGK